MKWNVLLLLLFLILAALVFVVYKNQQPVTAKKEAPANNEPAEEDIQLTIEPIAEQAVNFTREKRFNEDVCFLIDMKRPSGKKRFFIYNLKEHTIVDAGLVAHGSCNTSFLMNAAFSNVTGGGCSSLGRYKVGYKYNGQFGEAFKLHGLDSSNSNAFERYVVLHGYSCVPDEETHPQPICNSLGCPMISYRFLDVVKGYIERSRKPILLWVF